ncbi:Ig-like domain-containing protein [Rhodopirellula sp. MGV]|uniref:Ig-like domain-containing protein n=1 Tax=Rhodopirellula sp. MGV TaxID=2023130 RepID=UPI000B977552|nr:Ig-like domain-containing protein [Rhodopirellula sp. MGV]OYP37519.1 hypothetical protein CGZ80_05185 [Rhodopirellula sp. MGV]PNY37923.1 tandem-95 repeat protein [Rhodopirellula baltica]
MSSQRKRTDRRRTRRGMLLESLENRVVMDASLSGVVFIDSDGNGSQGSSEDGLPGVEITLTGTTTGGQSVEESMLTDGNGNFRFEGLAAGTYRLVERQPEAAVDGEESTDHANANVGNDQISNLVVTANQNVSDLTFAERGLKPGYVNLAWFLASTPSQSEMLRESVAKGEERAGNSDLADAIRDGASDSPGTTDPGDGGDGGDGDPDPDPNTAPVATADTYTVVQNQTLSVSASNGVLNNDTDADDDDLTAALVTNPSHGSVTFDDDGSFVYEPDADFFGTDSFTYRANDGTTNSSNVTVTITVTQINSTPNELSVDENAPNGTVVGEVEASSSLGSDVVFEINDASLASQLRLQADDHFTGAADGTVVLIEYLDLSCPHCAEIHPIVKQLLSDFPDDLLVVRRHFVLESNGTAIFPNSMAAAKAAEAAGRQGKFDEMVDLLFTNQSQWSSASDPTSLFNSYAQQLQIDLTQFTSDRQAQTIENRIERDQADASDLGLNSTPSFFVNGTATSNPETLAAFRPIIQAEIDDSDRAFALDRLTGEITVADSGQLDFETTPTFNLSVRATGDTSEVIAVSIDLFDANEVAPVAQNDSYTTGAGTELVVSAAEGVLANDSDTDSETLYANLTANPSHGTVTLNENGSFTYTPDAGFSGTDSFTYRADDGNFATSDTTVEIEVTSAPVGSADAYTASEDTALTVNASNGVLANDNNSGSATYTAQVAQSASHGSLTLNSDGSFTYTPDANFSGDDQFTYRVSDGNALSSPITVSITVTDQNSFSVDENSAVGTLVGTLDPEGNLGSNVIFEVDDPDLADELHLVADDHFTGDTSAPVVLIEYMDLSCPHCASLHTVLKQLETEFAGELLVVRRHLLLFNSSTNSFVFPNSQEAARVAEAAGQQGKFDEMVDLLFTNQDAWRSLADPTSVFNGYAQQLGLNMSQFASDQADSAIEARISRDRNTASSLGLNSTPSFFLNGQAISNPETLSAFRPIIQAELNSVDEVFSIDRLTGEIFVADSAELDFETTPTFGLDVNARGTSTEAIDVVIELLDVAE